MSRFIELLRKSGQAAAPSLGFHTARTAAAAPRLLLVAVLAAVPDAPEKLLEGAHAALLRPEKTPDAAALKQVAAAAPDIPWGVYLSDGDPKSVENAAKAGADFLVLSAASPVIVRTEDDATGAILEVDASLADSRLRAAGNLPVDALLASGTNPGETLTWQDILEVQRLAGLLAKPLLVPVSIAIGEAALKAIWEAGAEGVTAAVDAARPGAIAELRQLIDSLPPRTARKPGRNEVILPRTGGAVSAPPPDEEEEEEEYE